VKGILQRDLKVPQDPLPYFLWFSLALGLLPFLGLTGTALLVLLGIALPWAGLLLSRGPSSPNDLPPLPAWAMALFGGLAFCVLFGGVTSQDRWVAGDEIQGGMLALELSRGWHWDLFRTFGEISTVQARFASLLFKVSDSASFNFFFPSALFALAAVGVGCAAARCFLPRNTSLVLAVFLALQYWPLTLARLHYSVSLFLLWECLCLLCLGRFLGAQGPSRPRWAMGLGLCAGSGWVGFTCWPVVSCLVLLIALGDLWKKKASGWGPFLGLGSGLGLGLFPLLVAILRQDYGRHILGTAIGPSIDLSQQALVIFRYIGVLLGGTSEGLCLPAYGGFLSPPMGALFLLGTVELWRGRANPLPRVLALGLPWLMVPGFLTHGVETMRVLGVLPFVLVTCALGLGRLLSSFPRTRREGGLLVLLALLSLLDLQKIFAVGMEKAPLPEKRTYHRVLRDLSERTGPGYLLTGMDPHETDHSLTYFSFPFNKAWNPGLKARPAAWLAFVTEGHYAAPLSARFPSLRWVTPPGGTGAAPRRLLGILPLDPSLETHLKPWVDYYGFQQGWDLKLMGLADGAWFKPVLEDMKAHYPKVPKDPFLQSCYFEKLLFNYSRERTFYPEDRSMDRTNYGGVLKAAFEGSYRNEFLCQKYGRLLALEGDLEGAKRAFREALRSRPGDAWLLQQLRDLEKGVDRP